MHEQFPSLLVGLACCACTHSSAGHSPTEQFPALRADLPHADQGGIRFGCLPRTGDSTHFEVNVIVDSLREKSGAGFALVRGERAAPRPGYVYQAVTIEIQSAGQTRVFGTTCWHDAGIAVRGTETSLKNVTIYLDAPASVLVQVVDSRGLSLGDSVRSTRQATTQRITWNSARREFLVPMQLSQYRLAKEIGVPAQRIGEIVAGWRAITADTDLRLCRFFGLSNGYWLRAQVAYDTEAAVKALATELRRIKPWAGTAA